jgi:hypothetical protein
MLGEGHGMILHAPHYATIVRRIWSKHYRIAALKAGENIDCAVHLITLTDRMGELDGLCRLCSFTEDRMGIVEASASRVCGLEFLCEKQGLKWSTGDLGAWNRPGDAPRT